MAEKFDHGKPQIYFTSNFLKNHVFIGTARQKQEAEKVFLRRGRNVSTVLCFTGLEFVTLAAEIFRRQSEYHGGPSGIYCTQMKYDYWQRGGTKAKDKQRATPGNGKFRYGVRLGVDGLYHMCHFDGVDPQS